MSKLAYFDYIPNEVLCKIANDLTKPKDIAHFMQTYKRGAIIAKECVTVIKSKENLEADFLLSQPARGNLPILKFPNLKEVKVNYINAENMEQYLFLRFKLETDKRWKYRLEGKIPYYNQDESTKTISIAIYNNMKDNFIIELLNQLSEKQRNTYIEELLDETTESNNSEAMNTVIKLIQIVPLNKSHLYLILRYILQSNFIQILKELAKYGYKITKDVMIDALEYVFSSDIIDLEAISDEIDFMIKHQMINHKTLELLLQLALDNHDNAMVRHLVQNGAPVNRITMKEAQDAEVPTELMDYLREHYGYDVNQY